jgi:hypothetical protein
VGGAKESNKAIEGTGLQAGHDAGVQNVTLCFNMLLTQGEGDIIPDRIEDDVGHRVHGAIAMSSYKESSKEAEVSRADGYYGERLDV